MRWFLRDAGRIEQKQRGHFFLLAGELASYFERDRRAKGIAAQHVRSMRADGLQLVEIVAGDGLYLGVLGRSAIERLVFQGIQRSIGAEILGQASVAPVAVDPEERQLGACRLYRYQRRPDLGAPFAAEMTANCSIVGDWKRTATGRVFPNFFSILAIS